MNDWTAPSEPYEDHPYFPLDLKDNNPGLNGEWQLGGERPRAVASPSNAKEQFDTMSARLLDLIDEFNRVNLLCRTAKNAEESASAKNLYTKAVNDLNKFMGRTSGDRAGYEDFLRRDSLKVEAVVSSGFVIAVRVFGLSLFTSSSSSYYSTIPKP